MINFLTKMSAKELKAIADIGITLGYGDDEFSVVTVSETDTET